jgi:secreted trypsin-like serine protease
VTFRIRKATLAAVSFAAIILGVVAPATAAPAEPEQIVGGTNYEILDVPWQVGLVRQLDSGTQFDAQFCGGSIINANWVVTAAHCLDDFTDDSLGVFAGGDDLDVPVGVNEYTSTRWIIHPRYAGGVHDIALVKVNSPFLLSSPNLEPIALPINVDGQSFPEVGQEVVVSGWGATNSGGTVYPSDLKGATLTVISASSATACGDYDTNDWDPQYELCVGTPAGGVDTCQGDSGGPYAVMDIDGDNDLVVEPTLIGVTSWGNGCADADFPGLATRVTSYLDWIVPINPAVTITYSTKTKKFTLKWVPAPSQTVSSPVTGYRIEYSTNYGMTWRLATTAPATAKSYSRKIARDTMWRLAAVNDVNNGLGPYMWADDNGVDGDRVVAAPSMPTGFAPVSGPGGLRFRWNEPVTNNGTALTKYRVYRQTGTSAPVVVLETTERLDVTVPRGTVLPAYFWVTAVNNAGESAPSQTVMIGR